MLSLGIYRPQRPRDSPLFQLVERHLEELLRVWPTRFARRHGPLRPVVERVLREFLRCGLLEHGFARIWCGGCRRSVLVSDRPGAGSAGSSTGSVPWSPRVYSSLAKTVVWTLPLSWVNT